LEKEEGLPQNRSYFFEEVMGKLKLRDLEADHRPQNTLDKNLQEFTVLQIVVSIDQFFDAQIACRDSSVGNSLLWSPPTFESVFFWG
jgi:hypothetical protein